MYRPHVPYVDVEKAREFGIEKLVKQLMSVTDTLEIALQNRPNFEAEEHKNNSVAKSAFIGQFSCLLCPLCLSLMYPFLAIDAINKQFFSIFANYGMNEVKPAIGDAVRPPFPFLSSPSELCISP